MTNAVVLFLAPSYLNTFDEQCNISKRFAQSPATEKGCELSFVWEVGTELLFLRATKHPLSPLLALKLQVEGTRRALRH
jgi:hypothetical protein